MNVSLGLYFATGPPVFAARPSGERQVHFTWCFVWQAQAVQGHAGEILLAVKQVNGGGEQPGPLEKDLRCS